MNDDIIGGDTGNCLNWIQQIKEIGKVEEKYYMNLTI